MALHDEMSLVGSRFSPWAGRSRVAEGELEQAGGQSWGRASQAGAGASPSPCDGLQVPPPLSVPFLTFFLHVTFLFYLSYPHQGSKYLRLRHASPMFLLSCPLVGP